MWQRDWHEYKLPGTRVSDHALLLSNLFTAGRIGDYIESSARRGTERGLKYKVGANKTVKGMVLKNWSLRC
jgi:hypothetical protein